jgi:hypothetical protein
MKVFLLQVSEADYLINPSAYREVVWDIKVTLSLFLFFHLRIDFPFASSARTKTQKNQQQKNNFCVLRSQ